MGCLHVGEEERFEDIDDPLPDWLTSFWEFCLALARCKIGE